MQLKKEYSDFKHSSNQSEEHLNAAIVTLKDSYNSLKLEFDSLKVMFDFNDRFPMYP